MFGRSPGRALGILVLVILALALPSVGAAQVVVKVSDTVNFRLGFQLQTWADYLQDQNTQGYSQNFFLRRIRFIAAGQLAKDVTFFFQTDNPRLGNAGTNGAKNTNTGLLVQDAFGEWRVFGNDQFILDAGKMLMPVTRNSLQSTSSHLSLDGGTFTFLQGAGTQSDAGRDFGVQLKSYLVADHLEIRGGVFDGFRGPATTTTSGTPPVTVTNAGSRNSPRVAVRVVYNFLDTEKGYVPVGTNLGKKSIIAIGGGYDTQGTYKGYGGDFMLDLPFGPGDAKTGRDAVTMHVDYIRFDGGCGLNAAGTARLTNCLIPGLPKQDEIFTDIGYYSNAIKLQPFLRFEWNGFVDDIDHSKDSRRYMGGFNYYVAQQNMKITAAYERIVPNVAPAVAKTKNTNHFVVQLQFFYF